jgi:hypothetical protein
MAAGDKSFWSDVANAISPPQGRLVQQAAGVQTGIVSGTATAVTFGAGSEDLDTNNFHDTATNNSRVTPTVAGWYRVHGAIALAGATDYTILEAFIRKNGSTGLPPAYRSTGASASAQTLVFGTSALVQCNGSTDYFEICMRITKTAGTISTVFSSQFACTLEWTRTSA